MRKSSVLECIRDYDLDKLAIGVLGSHSALQILHGARKEGLHTVLITIEDRVSFYREFKHLVNNFIVIKKWSDLCKEDVVRKLKELSTILVPHGSYVEYVGLNCAEGIDVPIFGLRSLFRVEASQQRKMSLLRKAGIKVPREYNYGEDIDGLVIVKLDGAKGGRGYFLARSKEEVERGIKELIDKGIIDSYENALIQEYVVGVPAYYHYFYSPVLDRVELLGADVRYETLVDGLKRVPPRLLEFMGVEPTFVVVGNLPLVLRESLLPKILDYGYRFVKATQENLPPGIIGPFCLESIIRDNLDIVVFEFSGRIVAGTNIYVNGSPYSYLYWGEPMSVGRRIAREIKLAVEKDMLDKVVT